MNNNRKTFRFLLSIVLTLAMLIGNYGNTFAGDVDGDDTPIDSSVLNTTQNSDIRLVKGQTYDLAVYSYEYDSSQGLFSVDAKGKLTAGKTEGTGSFTIKNSVVSQTVTVEISGKSKAKVDKDAKKITIGKGKKIFLPGQITYTASSATDAGGNSLNGKDSKKVATVKKGKISAKGAGNATVLLSGLVDSECSVTIYDPVLADKKLEMGVGETGRTLSINAAGTIPVEWASSDPNVVRIVRRSLKSVEVDAYSAGKAVISATVNGKAFECKVKVSTPKNRMSAVALDLSTSGKGKTKKLSGNGLKKLEFKSLDPEIATVDAKGKITAVKAGTTHILVSTKGSDKAFSSTVVSVYDIEPDAKISVPPGGFAPIAISVNGIRESNGYSVPIFFKSAKTSIATVNANGFVHGLKAGKTKLTASVCGNKYTVEVEVSPDAASTHIHSYKEFTDSVKYCEQCGSWYIPAAYRISFNTNGGNILESIVIPEGETVYSSGIELPVPVKEGYEFLGWYTDNKLEKLFESRQAFTGNIVLYAGWEIIPENTEGDIPDPGFMDENVYFESFTTDIKDVLADGNKTDVTFYAKLMSQSYIDTDASEVAVYEDSNKITALKDDGIGADKTANDGIFSGMAELSSADKGAKYYTAKYKDIDSKSTEVFFYTEISDEEKEGAGKLLEEINKLDDAEDVIAVLKSSSIVDQNSIEENDYHTCITFKTISGIMCIWEPVIKEEPIDQKATAGKDGTIIKSSGGLSYDDVREKLKSIAVTPMHPFKKDICVIRPYYNREDKFDNDNSLNTGMILSEALNSKCDIIDGHKATLDMYRHFGDYGVVMIDAHGGTKWSINHEPYILTGENIFEGLSEYSSADFENGRAGWCDDGDVFVTAGFFDTYYDAHDLENTLIFLGSCYGAYEGKIIGSLADKGAVVYGFTSATSFLYGSDNLFELMLDEFLLKGNNAGTAFENAQKTCGDSDPYWLPVTFDFPAKLEMAGDNEYRLLRTENGSYVSGRVFSYKGDGIADAKLSFTGNNGTYRKETQVNHDGSFTVCLPPGGYSMTVSAYGYINEIRNLIVVEEGKGVNLDQTILLRPVSGKNTISGKITSSMDGSGVAYAKIRFRKYHDNENGEYIKYTSGKDVTVFSDKNGLYSFSSLPQGYYTMEVSRNGYYTTYQNIIAYADTPLQNLSLTPVIYYGNEDLRIVLEWGQFPLDMDAHLVGPRPDGGQFHVWFMDKTAFANDEVIAYLDLDDKESYGPETIRVNNVIAGDYIFYVNNYMYDGRMAVSNAKVYLYGRDGLIASYNVPMDQGSERYWNVFRFNYDPESGRCSVMPINTITDVPCVDLSDCRNK